MSEQATASEHHVAGERFVIVPTLDGYLELEHRVTELEGATPAVGSEPAGGDVAERLDRHRAELDDLKRRYNRLLELLRPYFPTIPPAPATGPTTTPESPL